MALLYYTLCKLILQFTIERVVLILIVCVSTQCTRAVVRFRPPSCHTVFLNRHTNHYNSIIIMPIQLHGIALLCLHAANNGWLTLHVYGGAIGILQGTIATFGISLTYLKWNPNSSLTLDLVVIDNRRSWIFSAYSIISVSFTLSDCSRVDQQSIFGPPTGELESRSGPPTDKS